MDEIEREEIRKEAVKKVLSELAKHEMVRLENFGMVDLKRIAKRYGVRLAEAK